MKHSFGRLKAKFAGGDGHDNVYDSDDDHHLEVFALTPFLVNQIEIWYAKWISRRVARGCVRDKTFLHLGSSWMANPRNQQVCLSYMRVLDFRKLSMLPLGVLSSGNFLIADDALSIIAVHGLNGKARRTWTDTTSGKMWLEDFLPGAFTKSRIMTFGYDSALAFSRSQAGIESFARDLLNRLRMIRTSPQVKIFCYASSLPASRLAAC